jgi:hypothetical protein
MSDKVFKTLRFWAEVGFAAVGTAYLGLSEVWNLPFGNEVSKTCLIIATLVGAFVGVSRITYNKNTQG